MRVESSSKPTEDDKTIVGYIFAKESEGRFVLFSILPAERFDAQVRQVKEVKEGEEFEDNRWKLPPLSNRVLLSFLPDLSDVQFDSSKEIVIVPVDFPKRLLEGQRVIALRIRRGEEKDEIYYLERIKL